MINILQQQLGGIIRSKISMNNSPKSNNSSIFGILFLVSLIVLLLEGFIIYFLFNTFAPGIVARFQNKSEQEMKHIQIGYLESLLS